MKRKPIIVLSIIIALIVAAVSLHLFVERFLGSREATEAEFILCYGEVNTEGHIMSETAYYFAECVKNLSKGKILIEIYPSGQMGDDEQCYQALKMGSLDLYRGNSSSLTAAETPMISVMALPYIFEDGEHFWKVCNSDLGNQMLEGIQDTFEGVRGLAFLDEGARCFMTTDVPITKLEDMKGMKIRTQSSGIMVDTVEALGGDAVPMQYVGLYSALQGNVVAGAENPLISYYSNKFYEVAPYYVKDAHTYSPSVMLISEITWNALGTEYQQIIVEAAKMAQEYNKEEIDEMEQNVLEELQKNNVQISELEDLEKWKDAVTPVYEKYGVGFENIIEQIKSMR